MTKSDERLLRRICMISALKYRQFQRPCEVGMWADEAWNASPWRSQKMLPYLSESLVILRVYGSCHISDLPRVNPCNRTPMYLLDFLCIALIFQRPWRSNSLDPHLVPNRLYFQHNRMQSKQIGGSNNRSIPSSESTLPVSSAHPLVVSLPRQLTDQWQAVRDRRTAAVFWIGGGRNL